MTKFSKQFEAILSKVSEKNARYVNYIISSFSKRVEPTEEKLVKILDKQLSRSDKKELLKSLQTAISNVVPTIEKDKKPNNTFVIEDKVLLAALKVEKQAQNAFNKKYTTYLEKNSHLEEADEKINSQDIRKYIFTDIDLLKGLMNFNFKTKNRFNLSAKNWCKNAELHLLSCDYKNSDIYFINDNYDGTFDKNLYKVHIGDYIQLFTVKQGAQLLDCTKNTGNKQKAVKFNPWKVSTWRVEHLPLIKNVIENEYCLTWEKVVNNSLNDSEKVLRAGKALQACEGIYREILELNNKQLKRVAQGLKIKDAKPSVLRDEIYIYAVSKFN